MSGLYLAELAAAQRDWLSTRQAAISRNVSNASTPGYSRVDVKPFSEALSTSSASLSVSNKMHFTNIEGGGAEFAVQKQPGWERSHSGNNVVVEQEMLNAADVGRKFTLNVSITKRFHEMQLAGLKG